MAGTSSSASIRPKRSKNEGGSSRKPSKKRVIKRTRSASSIRQRLPRHKQLRALRVQDVALLRYSEAVDRFQTYCLRRSLVLDCMDSVDLHMATFFADLMDEGFSYNDASYTLFGYIVLEANVSAPEKLLLPRARGALKGWNARFPQSSRTGADPLIWFLIGEEMTKISVPLTAALIIQLDTYARPSEVLRVRKRDVVRPVTKQCKFWGIIFGNSSFGERTKTGTQDDTVLLDSLTPDAARVLSLVYKACRRPDDLLFPSCSLDFYEKSMAQAKNAVGLGPFSLTPHSVRHSGPSMDFLNKARLPEEIMARGRWASIKSIQRYRKPGQLLAKMSKIPEPVWAKAKGSLQRTLPILSKYYGGPSP